MVALVVAAVAVHPHLRGAVPPVVRAAVVVAVVALVVAVVHLHPEIASEMTCYEALFQERKRITH